MYERLKNFAADEGFASVLDGLNTDDLTDRRPGRAAAIEHGVISPLVEAGLSKAEVRELSRQYGLPTWDKPEINQVDRAEMFLRGGVTSARSSRNHGSD